MTEVKKISLLYKCNKCTHIEGTHLDTSDILSTTGMEFKQAVKEIPATRVCKACKNNMVLIHAIMWQRERAYGDTKFGLWKCPIHSGHSFFPLLLKRAYEEHSYTSNLYETIAHRGFPPKCPFCGTAMTYIDERILACGYNRRLD